MKTPTGVSRETAERLNHAYKVGYATESNGEKPEPVAKRFERDDEKRYFWMGVCDAQVERSKKELD